MRVHSILKTSRRDFLTLALVALLALSFLLGGASRQHELRLALLELAAVPVLLLGLLTLLKRDDLGAHRQALTLAGLIVLIPLVQLVPLPPSIWANLPGREQLVLALDVSGLSPGFAPLSLTPDKTFRSALALIPPMAMFIGVLIVNGSGRENLIRALLGATLVAIILGAAQLASGGESLYLWATTAAGNVAGFFANRNHMATLCLLSMPFAAVLGAGASRRASNRTNFSLGVAVAYLGLTAVALGVIRSRTGVILFAPVLGVSLLAAWVAMGRGRPKFMLLALSGGAVLAVAGVIAFALAPLLDRFDTVGAKEGRFENWPIVAQAADSYLPVGSGTGSFDAVFRSVEPLERLDPTFFNQAHNDYLETWLETGWIGGALIALFMAWFAARSWKAWTSGVSTQRDLQRAASVAIGVILAHSVVDYPLRTAAIATVFALCCGLLETCVRADSELNPEARRKRRRS